MKTTDPTWQTKLLRFNLSKHGMSAPEFYEWHNGEALYHGEPIQGRATPSEQQGINDTIDDIRTIENEFTCADSVYG